MIPVLGRQRQVDLCEFQDSQGYTEKPCLTKISNNSTTNMELRAGELAPG